MRAEHYIKTTSNRVILLTSLLFSFSPVLIGALSFSVDIAGPTVAPDDIFNPGPVPILPGGTAIPATVAEVNAFSYGHTHFNETILFFSVDRPSVGAAGAVLTESSKTGGDQSADIYSSFIAGSNAQFWDGDGSSAPPLGLFEPVTSPGDDLDGLDLRPSSPTGHIFWSVDPTTSATHPAYAGLSPADIFISPVVPGYSVLPALFTPAITLGLSPADDVDALVVIDFDSSLTWSAGDSIFYSLAPGSPALVGLAASPADIIIVTFGGAPFLGLPAPALGLLPTDNLNALDVIVPEPGLTGMVTAMSVFFLLVLLKRSRKTRI
jgi:hypothetical protein